jgi:hypothetical protein
MRRRSVSKFYNLLGEVSRYFHVFLVYHSAHHSYCPLLKELVFPSSQGISDLNVIYATCTYISLPRVYRSRTDFDLLKELVFPSSQGISDLNVIYATCTYISLPRVYRSRTDFDLLKELVFPHL